VFNFNTITKFVIKVESTLAYQNIIKYMYARVDIHRYIYIYIYIYVHAYMRVYVNMILDPLFRIQRADSTNTITP